jgi:hypothetical protein
MLQCLEHNVHNCQLAKVFAKGDNYTNPNTTTLTLTLKNTIAKKTLKEVLVFLTNTLSLLC